MLTIPRALTAALAASLALTVGAPAASAITPGGVTGGGALGPTTGICNPPTSGIGQAPTGSTTALTCQGAGLVFVAPAIGQLATVIGPTILAPGFVGNIAVSAGAGNAGV
jgi:hypothetical protein